MKKDMTIKENGKGRYASWLLLLSSSASSRAGIAVKQVNNTGTSTQYVWLSRAQARRARDWLTRHLRKTTKGTR